jgi:flagellar protein FliS
MTMSTTELSYRKSAIEGASTIGLMIALFDTLVGDFRRAADALRRNDIENRCRELNHAALVLGQLESWLDIENGGDSAQTLARFYTYLRGKMMESALTKSARLLETQIDMILHVRSSWQQLDASYPPAIERPTSQEGRQQKNLASSIPGTELDRIPFSQSA